MKTKIQNLRNKFDGKIYIECKSEEAFQQFLLDAEEEGYHVGDRTPTASGMSWDIKAIEKDNQISNCGIIGHIAWQAGSVHKIDYNKFISGDDYFMEETK